MRLDKQNIYGVGGKVMNVLEKILEEIEHEAMTNKEIGRKQCEGMARAMNIVSSHLNDAGCENDDGWIDCKNFMPTKDMDKKPV